MLKEMSGEEIRRTFIEYFEELGHRFVPSSSLVPGGDQTLLFTNAGMVQFKDVFLGTDKRPYKRAVNSQKSMRVAGKHNDLDDVGRDDTHHTFFEMLGNWSFGDYYKKEAIHWAWNLLTNVYQLECSRLYATCFKDEKGEIPADTEAAEIWAEQAGMDPSHILFFGRKDNFWEMADTGPCGPCSEIHYDRGIEFCDRKGVAGHVCGVNGDCARFLELWNLVFIQYNRLSPTELVNLPEKHVDTGMGFERIVSVIQGKSSNYRNDLLWPLILKTQELSGQSDAEREENFTPYRVIADHARAAAFLIADGVVPGNTGRNYVCRMIIRRAARFGTKIHLDKPFLAQVADVVITRYGGFYSELVRNRKAILESITREEERFARTVDAGLNQLHEVLADLETSGKTVLDGKVAFDLYATHGLPLELSRDVAREMGLDVDQAGFQTAMEEHRIASGAGKAFGPLGGEDSDFYRLLLEELVAEGRLPQSGVGYDPYSREAMPTRVVALLHEGTRVESAGLGEQVGVVLADTNFYLESGGQISDRGQIRGENGSSWILDVEDVRRPAAGIIVHSGLVRDGLVQVMDKAEAVVNHQRRTDIRRNHTATHLLHAALRHVLGEHARQAGSLVSDEYLRFDFTHSAAMTASELERVEEEVNQRIAENWALENTVKALNQALEEGAMALFGEKYAEQVRTVTIGDQGELSYELCGGTHVHSTADIGVFLITTESSVAAGIRRIEAVTGRHAYRLIHQRLTELRKSASLLETAQDGVASRIERLQQEETDLRKTIAHLRQEMAKSALLEAIQQAEEIEGIKVLALNLPEADGDSLLATADTFRQRVNQGVAVFAGSSAGKPLLVGTVSDNLVSRGFHAGELVKRIAQEIGGGGGGKPTLAQAGGRDLEKLPQALEKVPGYVKEKLGVS